MLSVLIFFSVNSVVILLQEPLEKVLFKGNGKRVGIFGGTFNPIHYGHLRAAEEVRERLGLGNILFIPSYNPPLKDSGLVSAEHRYEMTRLATEANPFFDISDIECRRRGKSYSVDTLRALKELYPQNEFYFILGIDAFMELPAWYQPETLMELTNFVVISRPGYSFSGISAMRGIDAAVISGLDNCRAGNEVSLRSGKKLNLLEVTPFSISATAIRRLVREGGSIKYLLPEKVESYIIANKLYL